jgi:hypothetical protein
MFNSQKGDRLAEDNRIKREVVRYSLENEDQLALSKDLLLATYYLYTLYPRARRQTNRDHAITPVFCMVENMRSIWLPCYNALGYARQPRASPTFLLNTFRPNRLTTHDSGPTTGKFIRK